MIKSCFAISLSVLLFASSVFAETKSGCVPGTYLIQESSGALNLLTFSREGTVQSASSAQGVLNFSDAQGAWKQSRSLVVKATWLDFTYGNSTSPASIARVDAQLLFSKKCATLQGSFELRFFSPDTEDPLDITTDTGEPITDTFTGRRVKTN